jgi:O-antigen/teichoic acid export membrane protein
MQTFFFAYLWNMSGMKKLMGDTALYGLSSILARVLNFALTPLLTVVLSKSEYGVNSLLYVSIAFLMVILTYGFETAYFRVSQKKGADEDAVYSTAMWSLLGSTALFLAAMAFVYPQAASLLRMDDRPYLVLWMAWIVAMDVIAAVPFARLRAQNRAKRFVAIKITQIAVNFILCYGFFLILPKAGIWLPDWQVGWVLLANLAASAAMLFMLLPEFFAIQRRFDTGIWKTMLAFGFPLLLAGLPGVANEMADRFFIEYLMPAATAKEAVGTYSAIYKLSIFIILFNQAFRFAAEPVFFKESAQTRQQLADVLRLFTGILCIGMVWVLAALGGIKYFIDPKYWDSLHILYALLLANVFLSMNTQISMWYKLSDQTRMGVYITLTGFVVTVVGNLALIPHLGIEGAAWTTLGSYITMTALSIVLGQYYFPVPYAFGRLALYVGAAAILGHMALYFSLTTLWPSVLAACAMLGLVLYAERKVLFGHKNAR